MQFISAYEQNRLRGALFTGIYVGISIAENVGSGDCLSCGKEESVGWVEIDTSACSVRAHSCFECLRTFLSHIKSQKVDQETKRKRLRALADKRGVGEVYRCTGELNMCQVCEQMSTVCISAPLLSCDSPCEGLRGVAGVALETVLACSHCVFGIVASQNIYSWAALNVMCSEHGAPKDILCVLTGTLIAATCDLFCAPELPNLIYVIADRWN